MRASILAVVFAAGFAGGLLVAVQEHEAPALPAERVTGIGGVFLKARDPKALGRWYREKLGIAVTDDQPYLPFQWRERENPERVGTTVWALFRSESRYFEPSRAAFMVNYRVGNLDRMLAQLKDQGVTPEGEIADEFNGKFAWVVDPEGNKIELWEPKAEF